MSRHLKTSVLAGVLLLPLATTLFAQESSGRVPSAPENASSAGNATNDTPEAKVRAMVAGWQSRLAELEKAARTADLDTLQAELHTLTEEMTVHVATGHEELLAKVLRLDTMLHTLMRQATDARRFPQMPFSALRSIQIARQLWPAVVDDLDSFGRLGSEIQEALREADREAAKLRQRAAKARTKKDFLAPNRQGSHEPRYPPAAKAAGLESVVRIQYLIDEDGTTISPEVVNRDVPSSLLLGALRTVLEARFEPAMLGSKTVPAEDTMEVSFEVPE